LKILITGAAGFLASHIAEYLSRSHEILGVDLIHPNDAWRIKGIPIEYSWCSLPDALPLLKHVDILIHCAAVTDVGMASRSPIHAATVNVDYTAMLMEEAYKNKVRVIYISTHSVYGKSQRENGVFKEEDVLCPSNLYGATKAAAELVALSYHRQHGLDVTVLRMALMYGQRERSGALVSTFVKKALAGETITLDGGGRQTRDFNYVSNAVDAIELIINTHHMHKVSGQIFNVSSGRDISIRDLANAANEFAMKYAGCQAEIVEGPARGGEEGKLRLDCQKIIELGYVPLVGFTEGFDRTAQWVKEQLRVGSKG